MTATVGIGNDTFPTYDYNVNYHADLVYVKSGGGPPFDPASIAGLKLWFDAADLGLTDGALVSSWTDKSGQGYHLVGTGAQRPTYRTNVRNGKAVLRFDGTGNYLQQSVAYITAGHIFIVATWTGGSAFPDYNGLVMGTTALILLGTAGSTAWYTFEGGTTYHYNGTPATTAQTPFFEWAVMSVGRTPVLTSFAMVVGLDRGHTRRGTGSATWARSSRMTTSSPMPSASRSRRT